MLLKEERNQLMLPSNKLVNFSSYRIKWPKMQWSLNRMKCRYYIWFRLVSAKYGEAALKTVENMWHAL